MKTSSPSFQNDSRVRSACLVAAILASLLFYANAGEAAKGDPAITQKTPEAGVETIHVNRVEVETGTSSSREGKITLNLKVSFDGLPNKPYAMMHGGHFISAKNADGKIKAEGFKSGVYVIPATYCDFRITIPDHVQKLDEVELGIPIIFGADTHTLKWKIDKQLNETQKYEGWEFTPTLLQRTAEQIEIDTKMTIPAGLGYMYSMVKFRTLDANGKAATSSSGGGGGLGESKFHIAGTYKLAAPETFEATFVAKVRDDELRFTLKNVAVPSMESFRDPKIPIGARGSNTVESKGWKFLIKSIDLNHSKEPSMGISINAEAPAGLKIAQVMYYLKATDAVDDLRNDIANLKQHYTYSPHGTYKGPLTGKFTLAFPAAAADRLVKLGGVYSVLIEDESHTVELDLPKEKGALNAPLVKGPVTITALAYSSDTLTVKYLLDKSLQCADPLCEFMFDTKVFDSEGVELKSNGAGRTGYFDVHQRFALDGKTPAKMTVWYCNKFHAIEVPFEFKDIGLPRKLGKWDVEKSEF
jgi:hypothetical protein